MRAFIWRRVEHATSNWHHAAGVLAVAPDLDAARFHITTATEGTGERCGALDEEPDLIIDVAASTLPSVLLFPDAGCC